MSLTEHPLWKLLGNLYKSHPWHGVSPGDHLPQELTVFIEVVPTDTMKYEVDKTSGYLKIDRPQKYSNVCPSLYGFVPRTYCGESVAAFSAEKTGRELIGDGDPLDICILSDRPVPHGNVLAECVPIGGLRMLDQGEADDKIIAVLKNDLAFSSWSAIHEVPGSMLRRLEHYFLTYKMAPGEHQTTVEIAGVYDREDAYEVIRRSRDDYERHYGNISKQLTTAFQKMQEGI